MIPEYFERREIFITGGSGNIGKALIEKLLRSCNVGKIYVLLRMKRNKTVEDRLKNVKKDLIFRRLAKEKPNEFDEKVVPIPGDILQPMMGMTSDYIKLMENVSVVFHGAATIRFDEPLRQAIIINVGGTLEALKFAETVKHLELFMHISTFFSNPYLEYVENKWYEAPMDWKFCLDLSRRSDIPDETLEALTRKLITGFPNTYCFTKNITESMVNHYRTQLPVVIYRPSIVLFAVDDPEPGFPPSLTGVMGLNALSGAGILKAVYAAKDTRLDISTLDLVIKSMLYYTVRSVNIYTGEQRPTDIPVFHTSSCTHSELTLAECVNIAANTFKFWNDAALEKNFLIPGVTFTDNQLHYLFLVMWKQILPAILVDLLLILCGRKPILMKIQRKIYVSMKVMKPFVFNMYQSDGVTYAQEMLKDLDRTDFHVDTLRRWHQYYAVVETIHNMVYKIREVLLKEDPSTLPRSRRIMKLKVISYKLVQIYLIFKLYHLAKPWISDWQWMDHHDQGCTNITELLQH